MNIDPTCPICADDIETIDHLFWDCSVIKRVWSLAHQHGCVHPLPPQDGQASGHQLFTVYHHCKNPKDILKVAFLLWRIWKAQNAFVFKGDVVTLVRILIATKKGFAEWQIRTYMSEGFTSKGVFSSHPTSNFIVRWNAPSWICQT